MYREREERENLMAATRSKEFANFVTTSTRQRFGELLMVDNKVFSYNMCIAVVHRENKEISFDPKKVSRTTSCHQRAVREGFNRMTAGWVLTETNLDNVAITTR